MKSGEFREREFFIDNLQVRILFIIVMIRWTGLAPWEFEFPFRQAMKSGEFREIMRLYTGLDDPTQIVAKYASM